MTMTGAPTMVAPETTATPFVRTDAADSATVTVAAAAITTTPLPIPDYVCCVVTEGVWTWFFASLLIIVLFVIATLKYCHKRLGHPRFGPKNQKLLIRYVMEDEKGAVSKIRHHEISVQEFHKLYAKRCKYSFMDRLEFTRVTQSATKYSINAARDRRNLSKNQTQEAIPHDNNRVKLFRNEDDGSAQQQRLNYINASLVKVKVFKEEMGRPNRTWIVAQGPMDNTLHEFWLMVWQQKCPAIVMMTKTFEFIKVMCVQYWPLQCEKPERFGKFTITVTEEERYSHFEVRYLTLEKDGEKIAHHLVHYQYHSWPGHSKPAPNSLLHFRRRLNEDLDKEHLTGAGPPMIHCSDGASRSGTYLAIDFNLHMAETMQSVDIFGIVKGLKEQRRCLVASPGDLRFIYDVVEDHLLCGETFIHTNDLLATLKVKSEKNRLTGLNAYQKEHHLLSSLIPRFTIGDCAAGHRAENHNKNRNSLIVPPDNSRPYLKLYRTDEFTDYINAVFVDGYMNSNEFVCAEWPMNNTIINFWSMVYDHDIRTMVVLNNPHKRNSYPYFWPQNENKSKTFGHEFRVECVDCDSVEGKFTWWELKIYKQDVAPHKSNSVDAHGIGKPSLSTLLDIMKSPPKTLRLFQIHSWPAGQIVPSSTLALVSLIDQVCQWRGRGQGRSHNGDGEVTDDRVLVVSTDGYSRCGIYCTAVACLQQVYHRQEVDVFQTVKTVRKNRPQLVNSPVEYKYCYDVVLHYVLNYCRPD